MIKNLEELAKMIARRDHISFKEAQAAINSTAKDLAFVFYNGNLDEAEDILKMDLGLEPDYLDLFIF